MNHRRPHCAAHTVVLILIKRGRRLRFLQGLDQGGDFLGAGDSDRSFIAQTQQKQRVDADFQQEIVTDLDGITWHGESPFGK